MTAPAPLLPLIECFVQCFTQPGLANFAHFIWAHAALWGAPHCVTETMRVTLRHHVVHWTTPYAFMKRGAWSCAQVSRRLFDLLRERLNLEMEITWVIDDTLVRRWGRKFFGLGCYPDPTDKNPGAWRRRVWGQCWVVGALLWEAAPGQWYCFPLAGLMFVPVAACAAADWAFQTKIALAVKLLQRLAFTGLRVTLVVDNLYAKKELIEAALGTASLRLVSRLRSNARMYAPPPKREPGTRGRPPKRGEKLSVRRLWRRKKRALTARIYGKRVTIQAVVAVVIPSPTLGDKPMVVVVTRRRSGDKFNIFFSTDAQMDPVRLLELYAARFKIEDAFDELKTYGGMADGRQIGFTANKRHVTLTLVAYSLLRLLSVKGAEGLEVPGDPWWNPPGPPSVTRMRRAIRKLFPISQHLSQHSRPEHKPQEIPPLKKTA